MSAGGTVRTSPGEVNASAVASIVAFALSQGMSVDCIQAATNYPITQLIVPHGRLPVRVRDALWAELSRLHGHRTLAIDIARSTSLAVFDGLAEGVRHAPDLRDALKLLVRNRCILGDHVRFDLDETPNRCAFFLTSCSGSEAARLADEAGTITIIRMLLEAFGAALHIDELTFSASASGPSQEYRGMLGVTPRFDCGRDNVIVFSRQALDLQARHANLHRFQATELYLDLRRRLVQDSQAPAPLARLSSALAKRVEVGDYTAEGAAREANMSLRSAQRLAALHGKTLSSMIDDVRASRAQLFITTDPDTPVEALAEQLGYSDERAFRRAFHRWTDMTPAAFKRLVRQTAMS